MNLISRLPERAPHRPRPDATVSIGRPRVSPTSVSQFNYLGGRGNSCRSKRYHVVPSSTTCPSVVGRTALACSPRRDAFATGAARLWTTNESECNRIASQTQSRPLRRTAPRTGDLAYRIPVKTAARDKGRCARPVASRSEANWEYRNGQSKNCTCPDCREQTSGARRYDSPPNQSRASGKWAKRLEWISPLIYAAYQMSIAKEPYDETKQIIRRNENYY